MSFFKKIIFSVIINSLVFWFLNEHFNEWIKPFFEGQFEVSGGTISFVFLAILFGLLNSTIKPILKIITIPIRLLTVGLFGFVINAFMLLLLEIGVNFLQLFNTKLIIIGIGTYFLVGLILATINATIHLIED